MKRVVFILLSIILFFQTSFAHKVLLMAEDNEDGTVYVEGALSTGESLAGNTINFINAETGENIWNGVLSDDASLTAPMPKVPYRIELTMGVGHSASIIGPLTEGKNDKKQALKLPVAKASEEASSGSKIVVTSMPFIEDLLKNILKKTDITVLNPLPKFTSVKSIPEFVKNNRPWLDSLAMSTDAVIDIRSIWTDDNLYNYLRIKNIRIVEIDIATPFNPHKSGIGTINRDNKKDSELVWLSISNLIRMVDIMSSDLKTLFPKDSSIINSNSSLYTNKLFRLKAKYEILFGEIDDFEAATLTTDFDYLFADINLFITNRYDSEDKIKPEDKKNRVIINSFKSPKTPTTILKTGETNISDADGIFGVIQNNYKTLYSSLKESKNGKK